MSPISSTLFPYRLHTVDQRTVTERERKRKNKKKKQKYQRQKSTVIRIEFRAWKLVTNHKTAHEILWWMASTYWSIIFNEKLCSWFIVVIDFHCCHCPTPRNYYVRMITSVFTAAQLFSLLLFGSEWSDLPLIHWLFDFSASRRTFCHTLYFIWTRLLGRKISQYESMQQDTQKSHPSQPWNRNINRKWQMYDWLFRLHAKNAYKDAECNNNENAVAPLLHHEKCHANLMMSYNYMWFTTIRPTTTLAYGARKFDVFLLRSSSTALSHRLSAYFPLSAFGLCVVVCVCVSGVEKRCSRRCVWTTQHKKNHHERERTILYKFLTDLLLQRVIDSI